MRHHRVLWHNDIIIETDGCGGCLESKPVTDLEGVGSASHANRCVIIEVMLGGDSGGLECNLKGCNEILSININCFK